MSEERADFHRRIAVIGGGITGLAAAHRLVELRGAGGPAGVMIELFDAAPRLGGCFGTERIGEYAIETGADSFVTDKPWGVELCRRLGLESSLIGIDPRHRRALIAKDGRTWPVPEGLALMAPTSIGALWRTPLLSPAGRLRAAGEYLVPRRRDNGDESIAAFAVRRFGQEMYDRVIQPLVGGIYTGDPAQLSLAATFPRFIEMEQSAGGLIRAMRSRRRDNIEATADSGVRYGLFATPRGGMSELQDALRKRIAAAATVHTGQRVTAVSRRTSTTGFDIETDDGRTHSADAVILSLPAWRVAEVIGGTAPELARELGAIEFASSAIVVTGHRLSDVSHPLDAAGVVVPHRESRRILAVSFLSRKFPSRAPADRVILRTFVGGALQPELLNADDDGLSQLVLSELNALLGVSGRPDFTRVVRYDRAMPQYSLGHIERITRIEQLAAQIPGLELAGNAYHGVGVPDCIHSGEMAAERTWAHLVAGAKPQA
jgi:protoporphyrinogen/coproporphyrinogen III oxidase